ncbi:methyltransferase [Runella slithyformis]|uniref:O-methyltransferase family 2 n=1 Tax=Runella slithyformis (strain ATCC 29530 / DSM 19594 / LMG 11500 / NCIMB 11436 / LSU 4) TaxID=761193 RepID=A0A7U4E942_RUNSL|nr:methyltransferase [Runella slithyformis]AEI52004.1 O-methyltransferase family 2 [Runella slithyformis DSM 19594]
MPSPVFSDLAPITRYARAMYSSRLLIAAVHHLDVFEHLAHGPLFLSDLQARLGLRDRPAMVLFPALCAMGMLEYDSAGKLQLTATGTHLTRGSIPTLTDYVGLEKNDPGVIEMAERLQNDGPRKVAVTGTAYVKEGEGPSPMDDPEAARALTLALAGRAQSLAPIVAEKLPKHSGHLLDMAGGTGYFSYEWLLLNPKATATVFDRPQVLAVAAELLDAFCQTGRPGAAGVRERVTFQSGDMLTDELPQTDLLLAASLFHDWPLETCRILADRFAAVLRPGGELWIHDAFLNDTLDGPLAVTDYSAQLFWVTKGRAYSRAEYRALLHNSGLASSPKSFDTQMDYGLIWARKQMLY